MSDYAPLSVAGRQVHPSFGSDHSFACEEEDAREGLSRTGKVPLLNEEIVIDDDDATIVMVFPKMDDAGGTVPTDMVIEDPLQEAHRIFHRHKSTVNIDTLDSGFSSFQGVDSVSSAEYQRVVREKVIDVLQLSGLQVKVFESIDADEVFVKISLPRDGEVIRQLATRFRYKMPFAEIAYSRMKPVGGYPGHRAMRNRNGKAVPAYVEFNEDVNSFVEPFQEIDEIRLIEMQLDCWLNVLEMKKQQVISMIFPAARYKLVRELNRTWASPFLITRLPSRDHIDVLRAYFGEQITFFFDWFSFYSLGLGCLAILALLCSLRHVAGLSTEQARIVQIGFAFVVVGWTTVVTGLFKNHSSRTSQRWGMKDFDVFSMERPTYDANLEGTWMLFARYLLSVVVLVCYCVAFIAAVGASEAFKMHRKMAGDCFWRDYGAWITVGLIKGFGFVWGVLVPKLADLQNHRTQRRWGDAVALMLVSVKLFTALWPFLFLAFLKKYTDPTCVPASQTIEDAARLAYPNLQWPSGITMPDDGFGWLQPYTYVGANNATCITGCFPAECLPRSDGVGFLCLTNCKLNLETQLLTVYVFHVASTIFFLVVPILLTKFQVWREVMSVKGEDADEEEDASVSYSFIQLQAKCHEQAAYEYKSWGGSESEDFLELAIGFALLACFGIMLPELAIFAFLAQLVEYRLLAFRMTNVTCRPMPCGADGIGAWQTVLETICTAAIICNVGLAVFELRPMMDWSNQGEFEGFIVLEHAMLGLRYLIRGLIPNEPADVMHIEDFNTVVVKKIERHPPLNVPSDEKPDLTPLREALGLVGPRGSPRSLVTL